ncbi:MAG: hypothetical protein C0602_10705 [Denitrovibrio sp.]|nr:MAG: hypothetical protein C0602_10705 [Denitrovibrio sp.]
MLKRIFIMTLVVSLFISCAKRVPHTVQAYQPGDEARKCSSLLSEVSYYHNKISGKMGEVNSRTGKNAALGVAGVFLIVPWFFMDMSGAEKTELESYKMRIDRLQLIAMDKECNFTPVKFENIEEKNSEARNELENSETPE